MNTWNHFVVVVAAEWFCFLFALLKIQGNFFSGLGLRSRQSRQHVDLVKGEKVLFRPSVNLSLNLKI